MPFEKIETKKKGAYIIEQIVKAIQDGEYKVGDKLPAEREIAEKMGVSRPSVREASCALQIAGIIESKSGDGTYIKEAKNVNRVETQAKSILEKNEDPFVFLEARRVTEIGIVKLAAERATLEGLTAIGEIIENMEETMRARDLDEYLEADRKFHLAIARLTGNALIERNMSVFFNYMKQELWKKLKQNYLFDRKHTERSVSMHRHIYTQLKSGNKELAVKAMEKHFDKIEKWLRGEW